MQAFGLSGNFWNQPEACVICMREGNNSWVEKGRNADSIPQVRGELL